MIASTVALSPIARKTRLSRQARGLVGLAEAEAELIIVGGRREKPLVER